MRQEIEDWRQIPLPSMTWINGILLLAASLYLQSALVVARRQATRVKVLGEETPCQLMFGMIKKPTIQ